MVILFLGLEITDFDAIKPSTIQPLSATWIIY